MHSIQTMCDVLDIPRSTFYALAAAALGFSGFGSVVPGIIIGAAWAVASVLGCP